jgi:hypothetical protein
MQGFDGGIPEGRRPLERPRLGWEGNIKMELREMSSEGMGWLGKGGGLL